MACTRLFLGGLVLIGLLAACAEQSAEPPMPLAASEPPASTLFWAVDRHLSTGSWPEPSHWGEQEAAATAIAVVNERLLFGTEIGLVQQLTPIEVAAGGRLAPTRRVQLGCQIKAMVGADSELWALFRPCAGDELHLAALRLPALSILTERSMGRDHGGPVALAKMGNHLFVMRSDPFELLRVRLADLVIDGQLDLRQGARPAYGYGELLVVDELLWVIDRYADRLIQVRPQGPGLDFSRTFASFDLPGAIGGCRAGQGSVYCLAGSSVYALEAGSLRARLLYTAHSRLQSLLVDGASLLIADSDRTLRLDLQSGEVNEVASHPLPSLITRLP